MLQDAQKAYLEQDMSVEMLCAMVNNNTRCYTESMDFAEHVEESLDEELKVHAYTGVPTHVLILGHPKPYRSIGRQQDCCAVH